MSPLVGAPGAALLVFSLGFFSVTTSETIRLPIKSTWEASVVPARVWREDAFQRLARSNRWDIVLPELESKEPDAVDLLASRYSLIAIIEAPEPYALLLGGASDDSKSVSETMIKAMVGDTLADEWVVVDITSVMITAKRKNEEQTIELFPYE